MGQILSPGIASNNVTSQQDGTEIGAGIPEESLLNNTDLLTEEVTANATLGSNNVTDVADIQEAAFQEPSNVTTSLNNSTMSPFDGNYNQTISTPNESSISPNATSISLLDTNNVSTDSILTSNNTNVNGQSTNNILNRLAPNTDQNSVQIGVILSLLQLIHHWVQVWVQAT